MSTGSGTSPGELRARIFRELYRLHFRDERRERFFLASLSFLITFAAVRAITAMVHAGLGPFHNIIAGTTHIHHLVWGILLLLIVGYVWLSQTGVGSGWVASVTAIAFGIGAALTLDEFALWLNLQDVYWEREGRISVDVVLIFASLLSAGVWGGPFIAAVGRVAVRRRRVS